MHFSTKFAATVLQASLLTGLAWGQTSAPVGGAQPAGGVRPAAQPGQQPAQPGQQPGQQPNQPGAQPVQPGQPAQLPGQPAPPVQVNPAGQQPGGPGQPGQIPGGPSQPGQNAQQQPGQAAGQASPFASLPGGSAAPLFQDAGVRKALNISEQQLNQLTGESSRLLKDYGARVAQLSSLDARDRPAALRKLWGSFQSDFSTAAGKILDQNQLNRYRQLDLQRQGLTAFNDPQLQQQLGLTEAQRQQLQTLTATHQQQLNSLRDMARTNRAEATRRFEALQQEIGKQLNTILNETQQKNWTEMTGQPHEFPPNFDLSNR